MSKYEPGTIIVVPFPFTDLSSKKIRPALVVSKYNTKESNLVICMITTNLRKHKHAVEIDNSLVTGLNKPSVARLDKLFTVDKRIILATLGKVQNDFFTENKDKFFDIFEF
ncbi:conserved hypothetical protein [Desulfamplus magnetovallimortis]|uniref:Transcriptional modulator of MazE/toxin, MazF n=1 Tax=Desulfamplus magnetovallimortis TaxID=1246637 RepID=A0A1W1HEH0_9BACT|nr:type II toxin-antitoxin system PemK/MazF family toxin [Desulfamplus magnetovallimortis]SLM30823.1 conserved hypothetical protein [Desulfamplus magnetovallimortis]